jgi:hypothetical protein
MLLKQLVDINVRVYELVVQSAAGSTMKHCFLILLVLCPLLFAEDQPKKAQRLEQVIWNPVSHVLSWQITEGHIDVHGQYEPERLVGTFLIQPQATIMSFAGERRGFMRQEGDHLHDILDSVSHYLMSSTLWWQEGGTADALKDGATMLHDLAPRGSLHSPAHFEVDGADAAFLSTFGIREEEIMQVWDAVAVEFDCRYRGPQMAGGEPAPLRQLGQDRNPTRPNQRRARE